jgi:MFS family permease
VGERNVAVAGALVATAGTLLGAAAPTAALVLIGIALAGLGTGVCAPVLFGLAGRSVPALSRGAAVGTVTTIGYLGFVLSPVFIGQLAGATTLPWALAAVAVVYLVLAVVIFRLR